MTQKGRVARVVARLAAEGKPVRAAAVARRLGIPGSRGDAGSVVRRILGELARAGRLAHVGRGQWLAPSPRPALSQLPPVPLAARGGTVREDVAAYLGSTARLPATELELTALRSALLDGLPPGPATIGDALALLNAGAAPVPGPWLRGIELARLLGHDRASVARELTALRRAGLAEHDPSRSVDQGRWRALTRPAGYTLQDLQNVLPSERHEQDKAGIRIFEDPEGNAYVVVFDPAADYHRAGESDVEEVAA